MKIQRYIFQLSNLQDPAKDYRSNNSSPRRLALLSPATANTSYRTQAKTILAQPTVPHLYIQAFQPCPRTPQGLGRTRL